MDETPDWILFEYRMGATQTEFFLKYIMMINQWGLIPGFGIQRCAAETMFLNQENHVPKPRKPNCSSTLLKHSNIAGTTQVL